MTAKKQGARRAEARDSAWPPFSLLGADAVQLSPGARPVSVAVDGPDGVPGAIAFVPSPSAARNGVHVLAIERASGTRVLVAIVAASGSRPAVISPGDILAYPFPAESISDPGNPATP